MVKEDKSIVQWKQDLTCIHLNPLSFCDNQSRDTDNQMSVKLKCMLKNE